MGVGARPHSETRAARCTARHTLSRGRCAAVPSPAALPGGGRQSHSGQVRAQRDCRRARAGHPGREGSGPRLRGAAGGRPAGCPARGARWRPATSAAADSGSVTWAARGSLTWRLGAEPCGRRASSALRPPLPRTACRRPGASAGASPGAVMPDAESKGPLETRARGRFPSIALVQPLVGTALFYPNVSSESKKRKNIPTRGGDAGERRWGQRLGAGQAPRGFTRERNGAQRGSSACARHTARCRTMPSEDPLLFSVLF